MMTRWMRRAAYATTLGLSLTAFSFTPGGARVSGLMGAPVTVEACSPSVSNQTATNAGSGAIRAGYNYSCFNGQTASTFILDTTTGISPTPPEWDYAQSGTGNWTVTFINLVHGDTYQFYTCTGTSQYGGGVCTNAASAKA